MFRSRKVGLMENVSILKSLLCIFMHSFIIQSKISVFSVGCSNPRLKDIFYNPYRAGGGGRNRPPFLEEWLINSNRLLLVIDFIQPTLKVSNSSRLTLMYLIVHLIHSYNFVVLSALQLEL